MLSAPKNPPAIVVEDLKKSFRVAKKGSGFLRRQYDTVEALKGVSFSLDAGEMVGYIGPNGAGKSTTVKALAGILVPDSGRVTVLGRTPWRERVAHVAKIGVVFGQRSQLWWDLPVDDSFVLLREIYRIDARDYAATRDELIERLDLGALLHVPVRQLSLGQRMRCELAASLLHSPEILFLDEPTIGLDAVSKLAVREFLKARNRERGTTLILTTHDMDDIEALCSRVIVIGGGEILSDGPLSVLRAQVTSERWLIVECENPRDEIIDPQARVVARDGDRTTLSYDPRDVSTAALIGRITQTYAIRDLTVADPPIEQIIARLYERNRTS